jgi:hypothetical protein
VALSSTGIETKSVRCTLATGVLVSVLVVVMGRSIAAASWRGLEKCDRS